MFSFEGEIVVMTLKSVKCVYVSVYPNHESKLVEHNLKGKLVLSTFKLKFVPHDDDALNYFHCFNYKTNYFKYWNEFDIPLAHIYGIYACEPLFFSD